jgi:hypothetical protein
VESMAFADRLTYYITPQKEEQLNNFLSVHMSAWPHENTHSKKTMERYMYDPQAYTQSQSSPPSPSFSI